MMIDEQIRGQKSEKPSNPPSEVTLSKKNLNVVNVLTEALAIFRIK